MTDHEEHFDLAAYSLGLLDHEDRVLVELHLRSCAECEMDLRGYRVVAEALPQGLATEAPPDGAWNAIMTRMRMESGAASRSQRWLSGWFAPRRALMPAVMGVLLLVIIGLATWNGVLLHRLAGRDEPDAFGRITVHLAATRANTAARGQLRMTSDHQLGGLTLQDLPSLPSERSYEVWFVRADQSRVSGGTFTADALGQAIVEVSVPQPVEQFDGVGISQEPASGSPAPTTDDVLAGIIYNEAAPEP